MREAIENNLPFLPPPVKPGPFGIRFTVIDHRGNRRELAKATWSERFLHSPEVARRIPGQSFKASSIGVIVAAIVATFAIQDLVQRTLIGSRTVNAKDVHAVTQAIGLFAPFFLTMFLAGASVFAIATRVWIPGVARQWLSLGTCAGCRYDLRDIEPAADGCTVCPECGGAWKLQQAHPTESRA
ncbi:MAG: hypothetical protein ACREJD_13425 [Phycisphaerales bacterium]